MAYRQPPARLKKTGRELWASVVSEYDLDEHEIITLKEACRTADRLDELDREMEEQPLTVFNVRGDEVANPRIVEQRQQSLVFTRLMASLRLPNEAGEQPQRRGASRGSYGKPKAV